MSDRARIEVAFDGGQVLHITVASDAADRLEQALGNDGALTIEADDGRYTVVLREVVYVKRFAREARVGFGNA